MKKYILFFLPSLFLLLLFQSTGRAHSKQLLFASNLIIDSKTITINDEDLKSVFNPKAGKLSSIIDKKEITQITKLKISGEISSKDIKYIGKMPNITLLDLSEATGNFEEFPLMPNLSELYLPKALLLKSWVEKSIGECTNIEVLSVCINEAKSAGYRRHYTYNYFSNLPKLRKVIVSNVLSTGVREHGGFNETQEIDTLVFQTSKHDYVGFEPKVVIDENGKSILQKNDVNDKNRFCGINILRDLGGSEKRNEHNEKKITLPNVEIVGQDFFRDSFIEKITFSPYIKEIKTGAFDNCQLLSEIEFQSGTELLHIKNCAFRDCKKLKTIRFNNKIDIEQSAFSGCSLDTVVFINDIENLHYQSFHYIKYVEFRNIPKKIDKDFAEFGYNIVAVPKGSRNQFINLGLSSDKIIEMGEKEKINITVEKPGSILSSLSLKNLSSVESLTITGFLYETDLDIIKQCRALKYLDLSHTYITYSPEFLKKQQADTEALNFLFGLLGKGLDNEHEDQKISTNEYQANKALTYLLQSATEFKEPEKNCCIPYNAFEGMPLLETVKLPLRAACIYREAFKNCINLKTVEFPPYLKTIVFSAFEGCTSLKRVILPQSIETIGEMAFGQCISLEQIELPKNLKKLGDKTFINCIRLQNIIFPEGLVEIPHGCISGCFRMNKIVMPKSVTKICSWNDRRQHNTYPVTADFYFKSSTPPTIKEGDFIRYGGKVHIPKGSITAYYNVMGDKVEYIEE